MAGLLNVSVGRVRTCQSSDRELSLGEAPRSSRRTPCRKVERTRQSAAALARRIQVPTNRITGIINSRRAITGDTALRLGQFFGTSPDFWLNLQMLYELRPAQQRAGREIKELPTLHSRESAST